MSCSAFGPGLARASASRLALILALALVRSSAANAQTISLPEIEIAQSPSGPAKPTPTSVTATPVGQVQTTIGADRTEDTRAFSVADLLVDSPGISVKQGNGPRDIGISIRGSGAQVGFGIRNIVVFDDGFPVTQPDGLSRSDLIDPHAYGAVDVVRGPSSALYGNYATGGAINFHTKPGGAIDGLEVGSDAGSYGYLNNYLLYGQKSGNVETSVFASNVVGSSRTIHSTFGTQTVNAMLTAQMTPEDRLTFKLIENHLQADLSNRLSLNQFTQNPYQRGCATGTSTVAGCQTINLYQNGFNGATIPQSANDAGFGRNDNRAILGVRYEHDFGTAATWRTQVTYDDRHINQPTGFMSSVGDYPSVNVISDIVGHMPIFGLPAITYAAIFGDTLNTDAFTYYVAPGGNAALGGLYQSVPFSQSSYGARLREEVRLDERLTLVAGVGVERSLLSGQSTSFTYSAPRVISTVTPIDADRKFRNTAPEASLVFKPIDRWTITSRVATGYGTPQVSNLFVTSNGLAGNNTELKPQTNLGYDLLVGYDWAKRLSLSVDGFYEFFHDELINQSAGPGLTTYTFNAPRSEHRGVEALAKWAFSPGWLLTAAYTYDDQIYTQYREQLSAGTMTNVFDRAGNRLPGVPLHELLVRLGYDVPSGAAKGLGAYVEYDKQGDFYVDNANLLKAPGYDLVNVNLHYTRDVRDSAIKSVSAYVEARNITNRTYVASANNVADSIDATTGRQNGAATVAATSGSIYAGTPASFYGGVRVKF